MTRSAVFFLTALAALAQSWVPQQSGTLADLYAVSAVSANAAWASGAKGTFLRTADGGATWTAGVVTGAANLDFRAIRAVDEHEAFLMSSGAGELSRIYKTTNRGEAWRLLHINPDPKGSWVALSLWDASHGMILGEPVNGRFVVYTSYDGLTWQAQKGPAAQTQETLSQRGLMTRGAREAWFETSRGRVLYSDDGAKTWSAAKSYPHPAELPDHSGFTAVSVSGGTGWAVGPGGAIARWRPD